MVALFERFLRGQPLNWRHTREQPSTTAGGKGVHVIAYAQQNPTLSIAELAEALSIPTATVYTAIRRHFSDSQYDGFLKARPGGYGMYKNGNSTRMIPGTKALARKITVLLKEGQNKHEIAATLGISIPTFYRYSRSYRQSLSGGVVWAQTRTISASDTEALHLIDSMNVLLSKLQRVLNGI